MHNIFIQHLYPVLADLYKNHSTISYKQLMRELTRNRGGSKCCIAKRSKINPNINQLDISLSINLFTCRTPHLTCEYGIRSFLRWARAQDRSPDTAGIPQNVSGPDSIPLKKGCFRCQAINLTPPRRVRAWGRPLGLEECQSWPRDANATPLRYLHQAALTSSLINH